MHKILIRLLELSLQFLKLYLLSSELLLLLLLLALHPSNFLLLTLERSHKHVGAIALRLRLRQTGKEPIAVVDLDVRGSSFFHFRLGQKVLSKVLMIAFSEARDQEQHPFLVRRCTLALPYQLFDLNLELGIALVHITHTKIDELLPHSLNIWWTWTRAHNQITVPNAVHQTRSDFCQHLRSDKCTLVGGHFVAVAL